MSAPVDSRLWIDEIRQGGSWDHLDPATAVEPICEAATELIRSDLAAARRLGDAAISLAARSRDPRVEAFAVRGDAILLWAANRFPEALQSFERALGLFESTGDALEAARTRSNAIQTLIYLSRYDQALQWAAQAREVFAARGEPLRLARLDGNTANLLYRQDRFEEAILLYEDVEARFRSIGQPRDVAAVLRNKAVCQLSLSRFDDALRTHQQARAYCAEHGMTTLIAEADYNIAYLHLLRGDYLNARALYDTARRAALASGDGYHAAVCDLDEAELLIELNLHRDAEELAASAVAAFRRLKLGYEEAKARVLVALCAGQQGDLKRALQLLRRARRQFVSESNAVWPPLIDLYGALLLAQAGQLTAARRQARNALGFFSPTVLPAKAIHCRLLLARIDLQLGHIRSAEAHAAAAERLLPHAQSPALAGHTWALKGRIVEARHDHVAARTCYLRAEKEFEAIRERLRAEELRISFFQDKIAVYEAHFRLLVERDQIREAFATAERAKSWNLAAAVTPRRRALAGSPEAGFREHLDLLYRELETAEFDRSSDGPARAASLRERIRVTESELRKGRATLASPAHEAIVPSLEEVFARVPEKARLLEYFRAGDQLFALLLGGGQLIIRRAGSASRVLGLLRFLQFHFSPARFRGAGAATALRHVQAHLQSLHRELIDPVLSHLGGTHLIVAPHGFLHSLPFHALHDGNSYLGEHLTLSLTPSAAVFCRTQSAPARIPGPPAIFGVADQNAPRITEECERVAGSLPGSRLYLDEQATLARFRSECAAASILHIATHGRFRQDNPWFSSIRLGDGYLSLYDLYELRLTSQLVVLSGCSTGLSVVLGGDESVGLARGLLQAGATSAVLSLWDVHDVSTAHFMEHFYHALSAGEGTAKALRAAQSATREAFPHPFHWAPFILTGRYGGIDPWVS